MLQRSPAVLDRFCVVRPGQTLPCTLQACLQRGHDKLPCPSHFPVPGCSKDVQIVIASRAWCSLQMSGGLAALSVKWQENACCQPDRSAISLMTTDDVDQKDLMLKATHTPEASQRPRKEGALSAVMHCHEHVLSALGRPAGAAECFRGGLPVLPLQRSHSARSTPCSRRPSRRSLRQESLSRVTVCAASAAAPAVEGNRSLEHKTSKPKVIIAGAGIGGLVLAVGLLNKGFPVQLLERDLTAIRGEGARLRNAMLGSQKAYPAPWSHHELWKSNSVPICLRVRPQSMY